ncbi:hypothetical protein D3C87_1276620 [compost metagenome]
MHRGLAHIQLTCEAPGALLTVEDARNLLVRELSRGLALRCRDGNPVQKRLGLALHLRAAVGALHVLEQHAVGGVGAGHRNGARSVELALPGSPDTPTRRALSPTPSGVHGRATVRVDAPGPQHATVDRTATAVDFVQFLLLRRAPGCRCKVPTAAKAHELDGTAGQQVVDDRSQLAACSLSPCEVIPADRLGADAGEHLVGVEFKLGAARGHASSGSGVGVKAPSFAGVRLAKCSVHTSRLLRSTAR